MSEPATEKRGRVIGFAPCPYCASKDAEVKRDKNGNRYIICFDCPRPSQHFTHGDSAREEQFFGGGRFRPLPAPAPKPPTPAAPPKKTTLLG